MPKKYLLVIFCFLIFTPFLAKSKPTEIPNNQSPLILHDGFFIDANGLPYRIMEEVSKKKKWGYGNWENDKGYGNFGFSQLGKDLILSSKSLSPKKTLKLWGVKDFKLGKKKSFKSSGSPAVVQLVTIDGLNCFVVVSKFGQSDGYNHGEVRSSIDGYLCKFAGPFKIADAINFTNCIELRGQGAARVGRKKDPSCITSVNEINNNQNTISENENISDVTIEEKLKKLKQLFDKKLITKEEYDKKRNEILNEM